MVIVAITAVACEIGISELFHADTRCRIDALSEAAAAARAWRTSGSALLLNFFWLTPRAPIGLWRARAPTTAT